MRLSDVLLICIASIYLAGIGVSVGVPLVKKMKEIQRMEYSLNRDRIIVSGIKKICEEEKVKEAFNDFREQSIAVWNLDDFILEEEKDFYRVQWIVDGKKIKVIHKKEGVL